MTDFSMLGLAPSLMDALSRLTITTPTPIQARASPPAMEGRDILGLAQTGTGKTLAFGLPILHGLLDTPRPAPKTAKALILAPTRELVNQIAENLQPFTEGTKLSVARVVGGASINRQIDRMARGCDVLVATPGRLIDLLERNSLTLAQVRVLVLDEADQMLDLGFIHALRKIVRYLPEQRQTLLFSATMPKLMSEIADAYLDRPVRVQVNPSGKTADRIEQNVHYVNQGDKAAVLRDYLDKHRDESALVFARTKHGADKLARLLASWGFGVGAIHGNKSQTQRERMLAQFRSGELPVLVATDVAARGLDIPLVQHVYNHDLPEVAENYVHRIGRTARAGRAGRAVALVAPAEMEELMAIEKLTGQRLEAIGGEPWSKAMAEAARDKVKETRKAAQQQRSRGHAGAVSARAPGKSGGKSGAGSGAGKPRGSKPGQHPAYAGLSEGGKPRRPQRRRG